MTRATATVEIPHNFAGPVDAPRLQSSAEFVAGFRPPDFIWDGVLQRGFLYSLTGVTGCGKTAIALLLAARMAAGQRIAGHDCLAGRVVYLAGENADDVRMRWLAMAEHLGFDAETIDVHFIEGVFSMASFADDVARQIDELGGCQLIVVDTSPAYFEGSEENSNVELGKHARLQRSFTRCRGNPCVIALCHPTKSANGDNLVPRGGGAFLAEVDGNLTAKHSELTVELHWQGKLRGPGFEPVHFELKPTSASRLIDSRGRSIMTIVGRDLSPAEAEARQAAGFNLEDQVLLAMDGLEEPSVASIALKLGWIGSTGEPQKSRVHRLLKSLESQRLIEQGRRGSYRLTERGGKEALKATKSAVPTVERSGFQFDD